MKGAKKIPESKKKAVAEFVTLAKEFPIVGIVDVENLPAKQLQNMREQLRGSIRILMTKKRLMKIILDMAKADKKDIERLSEHLQGMPAMIFTKENPFKLYKKVSENKSSAPAKPGQTATKDIVVPAGPTPFSPGPIIGELGMIRIKTGIVDGKVAIKDDTTVVKKGEVISPTIAGILTRLGIEPMEIGLNVVAVYEDGSIFTRDMLEIDEKEYLDKVAVAAGETYNLAIQLGYATPDTIITLLQKASTDARAIGKSQTILADELVSELLAKAETEMTGLKESLGIETGPAERGGTAPENEKPAEKEPEKDDIDSKPAEERQPEAPYAKKAEEKPSEKGAEEKAVHEEPKETGKALAGEKEEKKTETGEEKLDDGTKADAGKEDDSQNTDYQED